MENRFSENFKELRKLQEWTQEQVAEILGVTSQAVSKWECGSSYPDIEMLAIIANLFKVSTDYLLGVDITKQEQEIAELIATSKKLCAENKEQQAVVLLRNALIQYPSNCEILYWLAWSLRGTIQEHPEHEQEAIDIYRRILSISKDSTLLCKVTRDLVYCYYTLGDIETAKIYVNRLPSFDVCREYNLGRSNLLEGKELAWMLQNNIRIYATALQGCLEYFEKENILQEADMKPYSIQRARKELAFVQEILG